MAGQTQSNSNVMTFVKDQRPEYRRPLAEIMADLRKDIPPQMLKQKTLKGNAITFCPWYQVADLLDWFAPGWCYEVRSVSPIGAQAVLTVRLIIPAKEGDVYRDATGIEDEEVSGYGDTSSNAESMALRRAAAKFGLGRALYKK